MADTDQIDSSVGNNLLAKAEGQTQQAADTQKAQEQKAEAPKGGAKPTAQPAAKPAAAGADQSVGAKAAGAIKSTPVGQGVAKVLGSFKKGGTVPETGDYKLHEGEEVVPNNGRASEYRKVFKSRGDAGKHSWGGK